MVCVGRNSFFQVCFRHSPFPSQFNNRELPFLLPSVGTIPSSPFSPLLLVDEPSFPLLPWMVRVRRASFLKSKCTGKDMGTRGFGCETSSVVEPCVLQSGHIKLDNCWTLIHLTHAPFIKESGCNKNTSTVSTPREKSQDKLVLDGTKSPVLKKMQHDTDLPA